MAIFHCYVSSPVGKRADFHPMVRRILPEHVATGRIRAMRCHLETGVISSKSAPEETKNNHNSSDFKWRPSKTGEGVHRTVLYLFEIWHSSTTSWILCRCCFSTDPEIGIYEKNVYTPKPHGVKHLLHWSIETDILRFLVKPILNHIKPVIDSSPQLLKNPWKTYVPPKWLCLKSRFLLVTPLDLVGYIPIYHF